MCYALFEPTLLIQKQLVRINFEDTLKSEILGGLHAHRDSTNLEFVFTAR